MINVWQTAEPDSGIWWEWDGYDVSLVDIETIDGQKYISYIWCGQGPYRKPTHWIGPLQKPVPPKDFTDD